jgi:hypothetical protein
MQYNNASTESLEVLVMMKVEIKTVWHMRLHSLADNSQWNGYALPKYMDFSIQIKDKNWFLHMCHHIVFILYLLTRLQCHISENCNSKYRMDKQVCNNIKIRFIKKN